MTSRRFPLQPTAARRWAPYLAATWLVVGPAVAGAQDPPPPPPPPPPPTDTVTPVDTAAATTDTLPPVRRMPGYPDPEQAGWSSGVWVWDREALLASTAITLSDLLERIPGLVAIRSGLFAMPEAVAGAAASGGRIEVVLDGYVLDPLHAAALDFAHIELNQLQRVRVARRMDRLRVELETIEAFDPRPFSHVEAGTGDMGTTLFRGLFLVPSVAGAPLGVGVERIGTDGFDRDEPGNTFGGWAKWGRSFGNHGIQGELRRVTVTRRAPAPDAGERWRQDAVVRARSQPIPHLTAEAYFGRTRIENERPDTTVADATSQSGLRATYDRGFGWASGSFRRRTHPLLPRGETEAAAGLRLGGFGAVSGDVVRSEWSALDNPLYAYRVRAELGPVLGLRPIAEYTTGRHAVPFLQDSVLVPLEPEPGEDPPPPDTLVQQVITDQTGYRLGAELARGGLRLAGAYLVTRADGVAAFSLPFDSPARLFPGGALRAFEVYGRIPLLWRPLALEGIYTGRFDQENWIYMPVRTMRTALVLHTLPLPSGNLEVHARLEANHRGHMVVPVQGPEAALARVPSRTSLDLHLQIRVLDLRAFIRWENMTHRRNHQDLPGRIFPGQRAVYGVKWQLWN